ncbi:MAG TPA: Imm52 family immunity protein, partial [Archangium sp.]|nr:Imm52 family immunity protein [Archangium sp.]
ARLEFAEECARRTEICFLLLLARCDEIFSRWYEQADSAEEALQRGFTPNYETLPRFFRSEENQLGKDGFSFGAWTGHVDDGRGSMVRLTCGDASGAYPNARSWSWHRSD